MTTKNNAAALASDLPNLALRILAGQPIAHDVAAELLQLLDGDSDDPDGLRASIRCALANADVSGLAYDFQPDDLDRDAMVQGSAAAQLWANALRESFDELESADIDSAEAESVAGDIDGEPWTDDARRTVREVLDWADENPNAVRLYMEQTGRDEAYVGHDFALSRAGHGTGLWDRGAEDWLATMLHDSARRYGAGDLLVELSGDGDLERIETL